jgi:uncharacterized RDD family membrane protein YckC
MSQAAHRRGAAHGPGEGGLPRRAARVHGETRVAARESRYEGHYEGLVTRGIAFTLDAAVINLIAIAVVGAVALSLSVLSLPDWLGKALLAFGGALFLVWAAGYFVVFWSTTGQTPGSRLMRIRVCRADDGRTLTSRRSLLRVGCLTLAAIPLLAGFLPILLDDRRRGLHDMLAGTVVVEAPEELTRPAARA